ncbi:MAG: hypothetical protein B6D46_14380 [Polyangiaceae bacterium UTPRO1]|jgi:uncharacterized protein YkwD|nr:CAP domain-containing protein [Myxococcales bacterium]OQY65294.1 MAG: hypothetical protein B6D46_14380 [Polyangiaceae bacterium UTPRO1]
MTRRHRYPPRAPHRGLRAAVLVAAIVVAGGAVVGAGPLPPASTPAAALRPCPAADASGVVTRVNEARRRAGLPGLGIDTNLARIAAARSAAMAFERRLSHRGWKQALRDAGLRDPALGENIAYNYDDAAAVTAGWMRSSGHRANILRPIFARTGVGCVVDARGHRWWTQVFAG